jgi:prophage regulatory protein
MNDQSKAPRLLKKREVTILVGVDPVTLWRWIRAGKFPKPRTIGATNDKDGTLRWLETDIQEWITALPERNYGGEAA